VTYTHYHQSDNIYNWLYEHSINHIKIFDWNNRDEVIDDLENSSHATVIYSGKKYTRLYNIFEAISTEKMLLKNHVNFYYTIEDGYYQEQYDID